MKRKEAIRLAQEARENFEYGFISMIELKSQISKLADKAKMSYEELLSESVI
jgi:hypothetical protein